jgi:hypothetical protein
MSKEDIQREMEELRKDVAALAAARQREEPPPKTEEKEPSIEAQPVESLPVVEQEVVEQQGLLPDELPRLPVVAALGGFLIGILLGRCLR